MFKIGELMKQAQGFQKKMDEMQEKLAHQEVVGQGGAGLVQITMSAKHVVKSVKIDPSLLKGDDVDMLEDLLVVALNDARSKIESLSSEEMEKITGGMSLPGGLKLPF